MLGFRDFVSLPVLQEVLISSDQSTFERLDEGKWVRGRFDDNIRIDQPTHGVGQPHAHVYGRNREKIGVVNLDGSSSHGTKCRLNDADDAVENCAHNAAQLFGSALVRSCQRGPCDRKAGDVGAQKDRRDGNGEIFVTAVGIRKDGARNQRRNHG